MQVQIELDADQVDDVLVEGLKKAYEIHLTFPNEPDYDELNDAFKVMLNYFMLEKDYKKFMHDAAKVNKKYNSKRLVEAEGGL